MPHVQPAPDGTELIRQAEPGDFFREGAGLGFTVPSIPDFPHQAAVIELVDEPVGRVQTDLSPGYHQVVDVGLLQDSGLIGMGSQISVDFPLECGDRQTALGGERHILKLVVQPVPGFFEHSPHLLAGTGFGHSSHSLAPYLAQVSGGQSTCCAGWPPGNSYGSREMH